MGMAEKRKITPRNGSGGWICAVILQRCRTETVAYMEQWVKGRKSFFPAEIMSELKMKREGLDGV